MAALGGAVDWPKWRVRDLGGAIELSFSTARAEGSIFRNVPSERFHWSWNLLSHKKDDHGKEKDLGWALQKMIESFVRATEPRIGYGREARIAQIKADAAGTPHIPAEWMQAFSGAGTGRGAGNGGVPKEKLGGFQGTAKPTARYKVWVDTAALWTPLNTRGIRLTKSEAAAIVADIRKGTSAQFPGVQKTAKIRVLTEEKRLDLFTGEEISGPGNLRGVRRAALRGPTEDAHLDRAFEAAEDGDCGRTKQHLDAANASSAHRSQLLKRCRLSREGLTGTSAPARKGWLLVGLFLVAGVLLGRRGSTA